MSRIEQQLPGFDAAEAYLWLFVVVALVLDVYLTYEGLRHGLVEGNPILARAMGTYGFAVLGAAKGLAVAIGVAYRIHRPEYRAVIPLGLSLPWWLAVAVNSAQLLPILA